MKRMTLTLAALAATLAAAPVSAAQAGNGQDSVAPNPVKWGARHDGFKMGAVHDGFRFGSVGDGFRYRSLRIKF